MSELLTINPDRFYKVRDCVCLLPFSTETIRNLIKSGFIKAKRFGEKGNYLISGREILRIRDTLNGVAEQDGDYEVKDKGFDTEAA